MRVAARALLPALAILGCAALPSAAAGAATVASIRPTFLPDRLDASTTLSLAFRFSGGEEGVPAPVRTIILRLPAGLGIDLSGVSTCPSVRLRRGGAAGCPSGSLLGRGHASLEAHTGTLTTPEQAAVWAFRGPDRGGHATLEILGQGNTPLQEQTISTAVLHADHAPYGAELTVSIPPIPTVVYEPNASFTSLSLTISRTGTITVPRTCPPGGFPFAAAFTFADLSTAPATASVPCPR